MIPYCILVIEDDDDREFMTLLYIRYQRLLYKEIYEILKNSWNTEDILQAALVKLIDKIPELRQKERPQLIGYICAAARNTALNFLRAQDKIAPFSFEEYMIQSEPNEERRQMEEYMISKDEIDELVRRWSQLDDTGICGNASSPLKSLERSIFMIRFLPYQLHHADGILLHIPEDLLVLRLIQI